MIDQKIILVDNRGIVRELAMRLISQDYTREMAQIGRFFDENIAEMNYLITQHYLAVLSHERNASLRQIEQLAYNIVTRDLCRYFPSLTGPQISSAVQLILDTLSDGYYQRIPEDSGAWDQCAVKELSTDTYAVICTRQTNQPVPAALGRGIFQYPINLPRPSQSAM